MVSLQPYEHVDPMTGNLLLTFTDLELPGNAGFDLKIQRTYNSKIFLDYNNQGATLAEDSWVGIGWTLHLGRVLHGAAADTHAPIIEMADGSRHQSYPHISPPPDCGVCFITREFWIYDRSNATLRLPNGHVYQFQHVGGTTALPVRYATNIADPFGNTLVLTYHIDPNDAIESITQDLGNGQVRQVTFAVGTDRKSLTSMSFDTKTWNYTQLGASAGHSLLTQVAPPAGRPWSFEYTSPYQELTKVVTPNGAEISYAYVDQAFYLGETPAAFNSRALTSRQVGGRDVASGTWTFQYSVGSEYSKTTITTPCNSIEYTFNVGAYFWPAWAVGLVIQRNVLAPNSNVIWESEEYAWQASPAISNDNEVIHDSTSPQTFVPLLERRTLRRGAMTYLTTNTYSSSSGPFFNYGRPSSTTEAGELIRTTARVFKYGLTGYNVDKIESETVSSGETTFTRVFSYAPTNGFLTAETNYGILTTFAPDGRGNVLSSTNASLKTTSYTYSWGVQANVQTPEHLTEREINKAGTVASEKRRGFTTFFLYDDASRLVTTDPPIGANHEREYDNTTGAWTKDSRGTAPLRSSTTVFLDGFGRTSGTENGVGIKTDVTYNACGRVTYESYPYTGTNNTGTTIEYDVLGRVIRRTHPDGFQQTFNFDFADGVTRSAIDVSIVDERGVTTRQDRSAFGDPDAAILTGVTDGANNTTSYTYNALGKLLTVVGAANREWIYNTKNQLVSETHPESGTTTYSHDEVGNVTRRFHQASPTWTDYAYDDNNRLTSIQYLSGPITTIDYDESDNRTSISSPGSLNSSTFHFDEGNRLTSRMDIIATSALNTLYDYDDRDNVVKLTYPSSRAVSYSYDSENRVTSVRDSWSQQPYANEFAYHPSGAVASYRLGNGKLHNELFDPRYRVSKITSEAAIDLTYGYDGAGNVTSINDARPGMNQAFTYDNLERLIGTSGWRPQTFAYDPMGNRTSKSGAGATTYSYHPITKQLWSAAGAEGGLFSHDLNGNLTQDAAGSYTYTLNNQLKTATVGGVFTQYYYDADDLRVLKDGPSGRQLYVHGTGGVLLSEYEGYCGAGPAPIREYIYAGSRLIASLKWPSNAPTLSLVTPETVVQESSATSGSVQVAAVLVATTPSGSPLACALAVPYLTLGSTATAPADFTANSGTLTFEAGSPSGTSRSASVAVLHDVLDEHDEAFGIVFSPPPSTSVSGSMTQVVSIVDDDAEPTLAIADSAVVEKATNALSIVTFGVGLSAASGKSVTVQFATSDFTATTPQDYLPESGTVTFEPGQTNKPIAVSVKGDNVAEPNETFHVTLSNSTSAALADAVAIGTIVTDDGFTDHPIVPGETLVRAVHVTELRASIDALRGARGLGAYAWSAPVLTTGTSVVRAADILEMRVALGQLYQAAGLPAPVYSGPPLTQGEPIRAIHITELRTVIASFQ